MLSNSCKVVLSIIIVFMSSKLFAQGNVPKKLFVYPAVADVGMVSKENLKAEFSILICADKHITNPILLQKQQSTNVKYVTVKCRQSTQGDVTKDKNGKLTGYEVSVIFFHERTESGSIRKTFDFTVEGGYRDTLSVYAVGYYQK